MFRGDRLKHLREGKNYTHQELANLLGVGYAQIYRFEAGKADPGSDVLALMASMFNVSTDYLLGIDDDPSPRIRVDNLSSKEREVLSAMRRGEVVEAIRAIITES